MKTPSSGLTKKNYNFLSSVFRTQLYTKQRSEKKRKYRNKTFNPLQKYD